MGDIVEIDDDGYLSVVGRTSDFIIRGGKNISAPAVEAELATHPDVAMVAAVPFPDPVFGERVCAYVEPRGGAEITLEGLVAHLVGRGVSREWYPERLVVVDALPRSSGGKVAKGDLREDAKRRAAELAAEGEDDDDRPTRRPTGAWSPAGPTASARPSCGRFVAEGARVVIGRHRRRRRPGPGRRAGRRRPASCPSTSAPRSSGPTAVDATVAGLRWARRRREQRRHRGPRLAGRDDPRAVRADRPGQPDRHVPRPAHHGRAHEGRRQAARSSTSRRSAAWSASAGLLGYTATKFAVRGMTKAAALELGEFGIRVNSVHPGAVATRLVGDVDPEVLDARFAAQPIGRIARPAEIAVDGRVPGLRREQLQHRLGVRLRRRRLRRPDPPLPLTRLHPRSWLTCTPGVLDRATGAASTGSRGSFRHVRDVPIEPAGVGATSPRWRGCRRPRGGRRSRRPRRRRPASCGGRTVPPGRPRRSSTALVARMPPRP